MFPIIYTWIHYEYMIVTYQLTRMYQWTWLFLHQVSNKKIKIADSWPEKLKTYTVGADCDTADNLYQAIDRQLPDFYEVNNMICI
jgi:hypothetical protein